MIMPIHESCFLLPNGEYSPFYKISSPSDFPFVIQHPYFGFDFYGQEICKEVYRFKSSDHNFIRDFIALSERNSNLKKDQTLWSHTGYWTISNENGNYIGTGIEALESTIPLIKSGKLVFSLANNDSCIFIKYNIENIGVNSIVIDIYALALFRPWIEILYPFRKTILEMFERKYEKVTFPYHTISHQRFSEYGKNGIIFPFAITPIAKKNWIGPCIIKNSFVNFGLDFIYVEANGGWLKTDFFKPSDNYLFSGEVFYFDQIVVLSGVVILRRDTDNVYSYPKEYSEYQRLIDKFEA